LLFGWGDLLEARVGECERWWLYGDDLGMKGSWKG
jgi:hypothetical protein